MTTSKPLSQEERNHIIADLATIRGEDLESMISNFKIVEAEHTKLTAENIYLKELNNGLNYSAEEADRKRGIAESALREAQGLLEEYRRGFLASKMFGETNFFKKMEKILGASEICTKKDAEETQK